MVTGKGRGQKSKVLSFSDVFFSGDFVLMSECLFFELPFRVERQPSPADSSLSIASPMPGQNAAVAANGSSRAGGQSRPSNNAKRRNNANANANATGEGTI